MTKRVIRPRIPPMPFAGSLPGAHLDALHEEVTRGRRDFVVDYHALCPTAPPQMACEQGRIVERVQGVYQPRRLRFTGVSCLRREGDFARFDALPPDHAARTLIGLLTYVPQGAGGWYSIFFHASNEPSELVVLSRGCVEEAAPSENTTADPVSLTRDWSPPPPMPGGLIPYSMVLRQRFGGDPVTIHLGRRVYHRRLFVGDLETQPRERPQVDAVLNVGENPSRWFEPARPHPADRWTVRGEGDLGMNEDELREEAGWVIERLRRGQRVLVHCYAGLNRSTTLACAVLILNEGLSAEAALARVREHHGWARPDGHHWLALKWLARQNNGF